jgi:hypothetical protein
MEFQLDTAILAGLIATAAMTGLMYMGFLMNMRMDMPLMLGTMFLPRGTAAWVLGLMLHLMMGAAFFVVYALLFDALAIESGIVGWAAAFGLVHGAIAGMAMGMMPVMHPRMATAHGSVGSEQVPNPGFFASSFGLMGPVAILMLHLVFGVVGGIIYSA